MNDLLILTQLKVERLEIPLIFIRRTAGTKEIIDYSNSNPKSDVSFGLWALGFKAFPP
jgi:hypothetical protein